jgi:hypothetical protein
VGNASLTRRYWATGLEIREYVGRRFPFLASKITVNGKRCTPRKLEGEHFQRVITTHAGPVEIAVAVLPKSERTLRLEFGAQGMREFHRDLVQYERQYRVPEDRRISGRFPEVLLEDRLVGSIMPTDLLRMYKTGSLRELQGDVYTSQELRYVVAEALVEVARWAELLLRKEENHAETVEFDAILDVLAGALNTRYGARPSVAPGGADPGSGPGTDASPVGIRIRPRELTLEVGGEEGLLILDGVPEGAQVRWEETGGTIVPDQPDADAVARRVRHATYTSGSTVGTYLIRAIVHGTREETVEARVVLRAALDDQQTSAGAELQLLPTRKTLPPGQSFFLRCLDRRTRLPTTRTLTWVSTDPSIVTIRPVKGNAGVAEVVADRQNLGTAIVIVRSNDDASVELRCRIEVRSAPRESPGSGGDQTGGTGTHPSARGRTVTIRDRSYVISIARNGGGRFVLRSFHSASGLPILYVDPEFPALRTAQRPHAFIRELLHVVVRAFVADYASTDPRATLEDLQEVELEILGEATAAEMV